jgi:hypothetical protein
MYDRVAVAELTLSNLGHVGFEFHAMDTGDPATVDNLQPGTPVIVPHSVGSIQHIICYIFCH